MPTKIWAVGEEVLAADFNAMVQRQVVATFPNAAARTAAIPSPTAGMTTYRDDGKALEYWTGTAWWPVQPVMDHFVGLLPCRIRAGSFVGTTSAAGVLTLNFSPALGRYVTVLAGTGDNIVGLLAKPVGGQWTTGATVAQFVVSVASNDAALANSTIRLNYIVIDGLT